MSECRGPFRNAALYRWLLICLFICLSVRPAFGSQELPVTVPIAVTCLKPDKTQPAFDDKTVFTMNIKQISGDESFIDKDSMDLKPGEKDEFLITVPDIGVYEYEVTQTAGEDKTIKYDKTVYHIKAQVYWLEDDTEDREAVIAVSAIVYIEGKDEKLEGCEFANSVIVSPTPSTPATVTPSVKPSGTPSVTPSVYPSGTPSVTPKGYSGTGGYSSGGTSSYYSGGGGTSGNGAVSQNMSYPSSDKVKTGDDTVIWTFVVLLIAAVAVMAFVVVSRRRSKSGKTGDGQTDGTDRKNDNLS